jgi:hypothetical protein
MSYELDFELQPLALLGLHSTPAAPHVRKYAMSIVITHSM